MRSMLAGLLLLALPELALSETKPGAPVLDKQKLESYLRYAEGYSPGVKFTIGDPTPTAIAGYYKVSVHLTSGEGKLDKIYYVTGDGTRVLTGQVWELDQNPFAETAASLNTTGPSFGSPNARITLVVFSDFQCPYCREFARTIRDSLTKNYPNDVRVVFKDFPLSSIHPWAVAAAEAARCVGKGKPEAFWTFHDWIFEHQGEITPANLNDKTLAFAAEHQLDSTGVRSCLDTHEFRAAVDKDEAEGRSLQIQQTPTFFINGRMVPGALPWASLDTLIKMELNRPAYIPPVREKPGPPGGH